MNNVKNLSGKNFKKINWALILTPVVLLIVIIILPFMENVPLYVAGIVYPLWFIMLIMVVVCAFSDKSIQKRLDKLSKKLNTRCWIKAADTPFPQMYLFDLENAYLYGLFALNPFYIQRIDLNEVEDVEIIYTAHVMVPFRQWTIKLNKMEDVENELGKENHAINSGMVCRVVFPYGKLDICLWHDRKMRHLPVGHNSELRERDNALRLKKLILDLKRIAATRNRNN